MTHDPTGPMEKLIESIDRLKESNDKLRESIDKLLEVVPLDGKDEEGHPSPGDEFAASIRTMDDA